MGAGRRCRFGARRLPPRLLVHGRWRGAADGEGLPLARLRRLLFTSIAACRCRRWQAFGACRLPPLMLVVRPLARRCRWEASSQAGCSHGAGRSCRCRGFEACRSLTAVLAGAAVDGASEHAVRIHCGWQELPVRSPGACRLHTLLLTGAAACETSSLPVTSMVAGRRCRRRGFGACRLPPSLLVQRPLARRCRWRGFDACRLHPLWLQKLPLSSPETCRLHPWLLAGAAAGGPPTYAGFIHGCRQVLAVAWL
jgi:hypothetical protein